MKKTLLIFALSLSLGVYALAAPSYELTSPDKTIKVTVAAGSELTYSIAIDGKTILKPSALSMTLSDGTVFGSGTPLKVVRSKADSHGLMRKEGGQVSLLAAFFLS